MSYVCVKKLSLGGKTYYPGDTIPEGVILSGRVDKLKAYGYIAEQETAPTAPKEPDGYYLMLHEREHHKLSALHLVVGELDVVSELLHHFYEGVVHNLFGALNESVHIGWRGACLFGELCLRSLFFHAFYLYIYFDIVL